MRKDNPYYKRGRPSQQAYDWEAEQIEIENRGKLLSSKKDLITEGDHKGFTARTDMYENTNIITFYIDFDVTHMIPEAKKRGVIYL